MTTDYRVYAVSSVIGFSQFICIIVIMLIKYTYMHVRIPRHVGVHVLAFDLPGSEISRVLSTLTSLSIVPILPELTVVGFYSSQ